MCSATLAFQHNSGYLVVHAISATMTAFKRLIIEGLLDGETIQKLLQVKDLTVDQTITNCNWKLPRHYKSKNVPQLLTLGPVLDAAMPFMKEYARNVLPSTKPARTAVSHGTLPGYVHANKPPQVSIAHLSHLMLKPSA